MKMKTIETPKEKQNYTYLLQCSDDTFYCGWTNDLMKRLEAHNSGTGGKYTRSRLPVRLVWYAVSQTKEEAMSLEYHVKRLTRKQKLNLILEISDPPRSKKNNDDSRPIEKTL